MALLGGIAAAGLILSGCSGGGTDDNGGSGDTITQEDIDKAMTTPTELTFWTWVPDIQNQVDLFEAKYPAIKVKVENVGQGLPHYQKLRSAIEAGEGAPDVAQVEYPYIPSFVLTESLLDLAPYGADDLADLADNAGLLHNGGRRLRCRSLGRGRCLGGRSRRLGRSGLRRCCRSLCRRFGSCRLRGRCFRHRLYPFRPLFLTLHHKVDDLLAAAPRAPRRPK